MSKTFRYDDALDVPDGPAATVFTGWRKVTPGKCLECGLDDNWTCDGRGNVMCGCQACPDCGLVDAYGFHNAGCVQLAEEEEGE